MIKVYKDWELLIKATDSVRDICPIKDLEVWFEIPECKMVISGDNVGLATYDYPGVYTVHWYYEVRGRQAIELAKEMCSVMFTDYGAETLRGIIKKRLKASRWATRQVGFKSIGFTTDAHGEECEVLCATKDNFLKGLNNG